MDLTEYTEMLRRELDSVTRFGGEEFARTAEMLADASKAGLSKVAFVSEPVK